MGNPHTRDFPSIAGVLHSAQTHEDDVSASSDLQSQHENPISNAALPVVPGGCEENNETQTDHPSQPADANVANSSTERLATDFSDAEFLELLAQEPMNIEEYDRVTNWRSISVQFEWPSQLDETVTADTPLGLWTFCDNDGKLVDGRGSWVPPIIEDDPDFNRFVGTPNTINFQAPLPIFHTFRRSPFPSVSPSPPEKSGPQRTPSQPSAATLHRPQPAVQGPSHFAAGRSLPYAQHNAQNARYNGVPRQHTQHSVPSLQTYRRGYHDSSPRPVSAGDILGDRRGAYYRKHRIPFGLQRIATQMVVEELADMAHLRPAPVPTDAEVHHYFRWQQGQDTHAFISFSTPINVDIRLLANIPITITEILTFFPSHAKWKEASFRLERSGWTSAAAASYQNWSRHLTGDDAVKDTTYRHWLMKVREAMMTEGPPSGDSAAAQNWMFPPKLTGADATPIDYYIYDLADGVVNMPTGKGAWLLTAVIQFARQNNFRYVKLSEIHHFIHQKNITVPNFGELASEYNSSANIDKEVTKEIFGSLSPGTISLAAV